MKAGSSKIVPWLLAAGLATLSLAASGHPHPPTKLHVDDADLGYRHHLHTRQAEPASRHVGQEALGAIQEVVGLLMADPGTGWSEVSIARLRRHLADLDEIMLRAEVEERAVDGGVEVVLGGSEQTLAAVRRLVPAHAETMNGFRGWKAAVSDQGETGSRWCVRSASSASWRAASTVRTSCWRWRGDGAGIERDHLTDYATRSEAPRRSYSGGGL